MSKRSLPYDDSSQESIEKYAQKLLNKSLKDELKVVKSKHVGKGKLGQLVEEEYFLYKPNSNPQPDFPKAGVELKTTPLIRNSKGLRSKERLVFNMIDFFTEHKETFQTSGFWNKNSLLLLMFYLHDSSKKSIELKFKFIHLWRFPQSDLKIIIDDWKQIVQKIKDGKAHEISEGDTLYLGACTKGSTAASSMRKQPFSKVLARGRAFSLKSKYLNYIIEENVKGTFQLQEPTAEYNRIVKDASELKDKTFEELVIEKFQRDYGKRELDLKTELGLTYNPKSKSRISQISRGIMGVAGNKIEEFEKADVVMKSIRLEADGRLKESMSFAQIKYTEIVKENWEESYWNVTLTKRFFFVVFKKTPKGDLALDKVFFWTMPIKDLKKAKAFWSDTRKKIRAGDYDNFLKSTDHEICHVRPKAQNAADKMLSPQGTMEKKKAYWLNRSYILNIVQG